MASLVPSHDLLIDNIYDLWGKRQRESHSDPRFAEASQACRFSHAPSSINSKREPQDTAFAVEAPSTHTPDPSRWWVARLRPSHHQFGLRRMAVHLRRCNDDRRFGRLELFAIAKASRPATKASPSKAAPECETLPQTRAAPMRSATRAVRRARRHRASPAGPPPCHCRDNPQMHGAL